MSLPRRSLAFLALAAAAAAAACGVQNPNTDPDPDAGPAADGAESDAAGGATVDCPTCTVLTGARLFDGKTTRVGTLVIKGGQLERVTFDPVTIKRCKLKLELAGKTVLPGLMDLHVHTAATAGPHSYASYDLLHRVHLRATLRAGVTSYLDLGSSARRIFEYRRRISAGKLLGPELLAAGPLVTTSGGHPCYKGSPVGDSCVLIDAPADVSGLAGLWTQQPDVLKLVLEGGTPSSPLPRMDQSSIKAVVAAAKAKGVTLVAHVSSAQDVIDGLDGGVRIFAHMPAYDLVDAQLLARLVKEQAVIIPTLAVYEGLYLLTNGKLKLDQSRLGRDVPAPVLAALTNPQYNQYAPLYQSWTKGLWDNARANLKACVKAGVRLAAGTDAGNPATFHGLALHRELQLYVEEGGMSAAQALETATRGAARVLGLSDRGALEAGQRADLLVVSGDPTTKIAATAEIAEVFVGGRRLDRKALELGGSGTLELAVVKGLAEGQLCLASGECAANLTCDLWGARCTPTCDAQTGSGCKPGTVCYATSTGATKGYCYEGDGCDLFQQDCANDAACIWMGNATTVCWYASPDNKAGGACSASSTCAKGLQCNVYTKTCYELCHPTDPGQGPCSTSTQSCQDLSSLAGQSVGQCM